MTSAFAAVDLGASSGRVILGHVGPGTLTMTETRRFRNGPVRLPDGLYWDILGIYQDMLLGLRDACRKDPGVRGIGIDSWAVDYGLVDTTTKRLLGNPRHYRDGRTSTTVIDAVHQRVAPERLYAINGLQHLPFNTVYQFAAERSLPAGVRAMLIPDLLGYWLTGEQITEQTNASTTGLLNASTGAWSTELFSTFGWSTNLMPPLAPPGTIIGALTAEVQAQTNLGSTVRVTTVGSHDTASAVLGVPAQTQKFAYISCGTWGLVGVELASPVLTEDSRAANFTNERGIDGTVRYLRNVMGLWLLSETMRRWELNGQTYSLTGLIAQAAQLPVGGPTFDPDDPVFSPPGDMAARIATACKSTDQPVPQTAQALVRCILDSLALAFAAAVRQAETLSGQLVDVVHIVGGGSQDELLCQLVADALERPVIAGPVEATALGNLLVQARTAGVLSGDLWDLRAHLQPLIRTNTYLPEIRV